MRSLVIGLLVVGACGGGAGSSTGTKNPDTTSSGGGSGAGGGGGGGSAAADDAGGPATTTVMLGDGGELQGTKLQSSGTVVMAASSDAGPSGAGQASGEPGRRPDDVATVIKTRRDDFRACYDTQLKAHPTMKGNIDIEWVIDPKGVVTSAKVNEAKSDIHEASVTDCMLKLLKEIKWAASAKGFETKAHYPFNFNPGGVPKKP